MHISVQASVSELFLPQNPQHNPLSASLFIGQLESAQRQELATPAQPTATTEKKNDTSTASTPTTAQVQTFVDGMMTQLLANRLGLNKAKLDELKQKIAELEAQKKQLTDKDDPSDAAKIQQLTNKIINLNQLLEQLTEQELKRGQQQEQHQQEQQQQKIKPQQRP